MQKKVIVVAKKTYKKNKMAESRWGFPIFFSLYDLKHPITPILKTSSLILAVLQFASSLC